MKRSELLSILESNNFIVSRSELFIKKDSRYIYCFNKELNIGFVVKKYEDFHYENILDDVIDVFLFLKKNEINIWNTYYLILLESDSILTEKNTSDFYKIERNSQGLRKYVIMTKADLYRIPFLFSLQENGELNQISNLKEFLHTGNKEIDSLIEWIIESVENDEVTKNDIKIRVDNLMGAKKNES